MELTLPVLAHHLAGQFPGMVEQYAQEPQPRFTHACLPGTAQAANAAVPVAEWAQLKNEGSPPACAVCIGGVEEARTFFAENGTNALLLPEGAGLAPVFAAVSDVFHFYGSKEQAIKDAIIREEDVGTILNLVSGIFQNPVFLTDAALRVLGNSDASSADETDNLWLETLQQGISSPTVMNVMKETGHTQALNTSDHALYINQSPIAPFFSANFLENGERVASLTVIGYFTELDERLLAVADNVVDLLTVVVRRIGNAHYLQSSNLQKMILDMMDGAMLDRGVLQRSLSVIRWGVADEYQVVKVELDKQEISGGTTRYTQELVKKLFPDSIVLDLQDAFLVVLHRTGHTAVDDTINGEFAELLARRKCKAGLSMRFYDFALLASACKLAGVALEKGDALTREPVLYQYETYRVAHMIDLCALSVDVVSLCHPEAVRLYRHDMEHGTNFFGSVYMYLLEEKHLAAAAKKLNIHRNTLVYRLAKLADICDLDLDDGDERLHLMWSYQVLCHVQPDAQNAQQQMELLGYGH